MLTSLLKSRPKSDRRREWKALKATYAKELAAAKLNVEIGLGKALDEMERQVIKAEMLPAHQLTSAALAPVVRSALVVKRHAATLGPQLKPFDKLNKFMLALKVDVAWWEKTARDIKARPPEAPDAEDSEEMEAVMLAGANAKLSISGLDDALAPAQKKTAQYTPPAEIEQWPAVNKAMEAAWGKVYMLQKNKAGNHALIVSTLKQLARVLVDAHGQAVKISRMDVNALPPVADWATARRRATVTANHVRSFVNSIGRLK
jgi:hypothetical protein